MSELWRLSATEIVAAIKNKRMTATEITEQTLQRLDDVNPKINAVVQEMPDEALAAAREVDAGIARSDTLGPLAGVPITIKVNVDQKGHATTNGLVTLKDNIAEHDSPLVDNLRKAGAIIVGRTNTPAFSLRWFTRNQLHGHTKNPRNPALTPGGSSGGAAAAVATGICAIGHGTDIAGSIRYPAYACGLHGLRPTLGRVPALNLSLPDRHIGPQITAVSGPIARTVRDVALGYEAMSQPSHLDPWWVPAPKNSGEFNKVAALCTHPDGLDTEPEIVKALKESAKKLEDGGWKIIETEYPPLREPMKLQIRLWTSEFHLNQGAAFKEENDPDANFIYEQLCDLTDPPTLSSFMEILKTRVRLIRDWEMFLNNYPIMLCPVSAKLSFADQLDVQSPEAFREILEAQMTQIALPLLSMPAMTVTTGKTSSTPIGVQLVAGRYREDVLFSAAKEIEARSETIEIAEIDWQ
ncbi:MAG: amidase family protein [Arenicellales bacterium]